MAALTAGAYAKPYIGVALVGASLMIGVALVANTEGAADSQAYTPARPGEVLEQLPAALRGATGIRIRRLHQQLAASPADMSLAVSLATLYIEKGRTESDPRYFGYAQAALSPWWQMPAPPAAIRVLRAEIAQWRHMFDLAVAELLDVVRNDPANAQAWLLLANIYLVQGHVGTAAAACSALAKTAHSSIASLCYAGVMSRSGRTGQAYALLQVQARQFERQPGATLQWLLTTQAEAALMQDQAAQAEKAFAQALTISRRDPYLLAAYADFLLDQQRYAEVMALLRNQIRDQSLLLRSAIAARKAGETLLAKRYAQQLRAYFAAERLRGEQPHHREAALFALEFGDDDARALQLAAANWARQKEPIDARILLRAARAAGDTNGLKAVTGWLAVSGMRDARLSQLLKGSGSEPGG